MGHDSVGLGPADAVIHQRFVTVGDDGRLVVSDAPGVSDTRGSGRWGSFSISNSSVCVSLVGLKDLAMDRSLPPCPPHHEGRMGIRVNCAFGPASRTNGLRFLGEDSS